MRIISRFHDYYDSMGTHDPTDRPVYLRETRTMERDTIPGFPRLPKGVPATPLLRLGVHYGKVHWFCLGICGKLFFGYRSEWKVYWSVPEVLEDVKNLTFYPPSDPHRDPCLGADPFSTKARRELRDLHKQFMEDKEKWVRRYSKTGLDYHGRYRFSPLGWEMFQKKLAATGEPKVKDEAFITADAPILYWSDEDRKNVVINPRLIDLGLSGVMDVYTIGQEIEMYLGSQLAKQEDPASAWTNEGAIHAHGFNDVSFRNVPPGERKERRKANRAAKRKKRG